MGPNYSAVREQRVLVIVGRAEYSTKPRFTMTTDFTEDLENWMGKLPPELRAVPIINLAIPGSHDTMSYGITRKSPVAPDAEPVVETLNKFIPCVVRRWAVTQRYDVLDQLKSGIRL